MLKELFDAISQKAVEAARSRVFKADAEPDHLYYLEVPGQKPLGVIAAPRPRGHVAGDLDTVIAFAKSPPAEPQAANEGAAQTVALWYSRTGVVCLLDDATRRDRVTLPLALSPQMLTLQKLECANGGLQVKKLASLLRVTFDGCLSDDALPKALENVRFEAGQVVEAGSTRDQSSLGRNITERISGRNALPQQVTLTVPVFASGFPGVRQAVRCALEVNAADAMVQLVPLPLACEKAICAGEATIGALIAQEVGDAGPAVYYGHP